MAREVSTRFDLPFIGTVRSDLAEVRNEFSSNTHLGYGLIGTYLSGTAHAPSGGFDSMYTFWNNRELANVMYIEIKKAPHISESTSLFQMDLMASSWPMARPMEIRTGPVYTFSYGSPGRYYSDAPDLALLNISQMSSRQELNELFVRHTRDRFFVGEESALSRGFESLIGRYHDVALRALEDIISVGEVSGEPLAAVLESAGEVENITKPALVQLYLTALSSPSYAVRYAGALGLADVQGTAAYVPLTLIAAKEPPEHRASFQKIIRQLMS